MGPGGRAPYHWDQSYTVGPLNNGPARYYFMTAPELLLLPDLVVGFLESLRTLRDEAPELYALFSEYRIVRKNDSAFDVVLYPMHFAVPVRIGTRIDAGMVQYIVLMLDMLRREGRLKEAAELDFRTGEGVLRARGDDRG